jgi:hypothetical protein
VASTELMEALFRKAGLLPTVAQLDAIREATCAYVDEMKAEGARPEQVVIGVRGAWRQSNSQLPTSLLEVLIEDCLKRYFAA